MLKRKHLAVLAAMTILTVVLLSLPSRTAQSVKTAVGNVFLPLFGLSEASHQVAGAAQDALVPKHTLLRENHELRRTNQNLLIQLQAAQEVKRENDRLRGLVSWKSHTSWNLKLARVVLRDPANWWRAIQIDLGSRDGVQAGNPVLTVDGLVGRVATVTFEHAQVVLLGDPDCQVSAVVENEARDMGVIGAAGSSDSALVEMTYLSRNAKLQAGERIVTSGQGGVFPKGIPVGQIVDSRPAEYGLYTTARVKPLAMLSSLEEVWVLVL